MRTTLAYLFSIAVVVVLAGCGSKSGTAQVTCNPVCPTGTHCSDEGCVVDSVIDLGVPAGDLVMQCACSGATPYCNDSGQCVTCLIDDHCPAGSVCRRAGASSVCAPGCSDDARCQAGGGGASLLCCDGACVDTAKDAFNCGGCGLSCGGSHASSQCADSACEAGACETGWGDCDRDPGDGCEVNLSADPKSCGACGAACSLPNALAGCGGSCYVQACVFGWDDCNGDPKDGCEKSILSDQQNCGGCGSQCPAVAHAKNKCVNASCQLASCDLGFGDCDGNPKNGCEAAIFTDSANCGGCGKACGQGLVCRNGGCTCPQCNFANASSKCVNNVCVLDQCVAGFSDCNNDVKDGCEADLNSDVKNCSACGQPCANGLSCIAGACVAFRKNVLLCGTSGRSPMVFFPMGMNFAMVSSCNPDNDTQAIFFSRGWNNGINANALQTYLSGGGIALTEYNISHLIWNLAFGTNAGMGARAGGCQDTIPSLFQFSVNDPFWQANQYVAQNNSGCGYSVSSYPGITPIMGWDGNNAAIGYRDLGSGRLWATDFDWQDNEMNNPYQYTIQMMGYMLTHRR